MPPSLRPEHLLATILSSAEDGLVSFALDGTIQTWSEGAARLYGYSAGEMAGEPLTRILPRDEIPQFEEFLKKIRKGDCVCCEHAERLRKDGTQIRVAVKRSQVQDENGKITGIVERGRIDGGRAAEPAEEPELRMVLEQLPGILWTTDRNLRITSNWGGELGDTETRPGTLIGQMLHDFLKCQDPHAAPIAQHGQALNGTTSHFEYRHKNRDFEVHVGPLRSATGEIVGCIGAGVDVTERKRSEEQIRYQATHDALTGLANYRALVNTLEQETRRAERIQHSFAVLLLDLDELKRINDRFGHLAGNRALKRLAGVIEEHCRVTDVAARYGGDEFAVVLIDADPGMARQIADRVVRALHKQGEKPTLSVSIGISVYPDDGRSAPELLEAADQHLYKRKKAFRSQGLSAP